MMQEPTMEISDETIPTFKVEKHNATQNRIRFKNSIAPIGDEVAILSSEHHQQLVAKCNDAEKYIAKINQLQDEINSNDINALNKQLAVYEKQLDKYTKSNNAYKQWNDEYKATIGELESKLDKYKQTIADKDATILGLQKENETTPKIKDLQETIQQQKQTIADLKQMNDKLGSDKDKLEKQLEDSIDASEHQKLKDEVTGLKDNLETSENQLKYWQNSYENLVESSDEVVARNESLIAENKKLQDSFDSINKTNELLNENLLGLKGSFDKILEDKTTNADNTKKELEKTIENKQSHIDEITDKYQSLLVLKDNIPQKQHYDEVLALKDEIKAKEIEIDKLNGEIETKLAIQKSELDSEHNKEKAQMLVAYNKELDSLKMNYNNLANDYNNLLNGVDSLTRINTFFNGKHNEIKKNKEQIPLLEIISEQLPPSDEQVLEFVPKD